MKQYKWRLDKLTALSVALINCLFIAYILIRALSDKQFLYTQTGLIIESQPLLMILSTIIIAVTLYLNYGFIKKNHTLWLILALFETVIMACILRNIFVGHMFFGFGFKDYIKNLIALAVIAGLLYNTLFSKHIRVYFN